MGHLFSRVLKRITQCADRQTREQPANSEQQGELCTSCAMRSNQRTKRPETKPFSHSYATDNREYSSRRPEITVAESIPVGQSIDSAEYAVFKDQNRQANDISAQNGLDSSNKKQDVEGAVIKIQALVRGHLTRKALKDAHQQSVPPLSALGQSQFDEMSLTNQRK